MRPFQWALMHVTGVLAGRTPRGCAGTGEGPCEDPRGHCGTSTSDRRRQDAASVPAFHPRRRKSPSALLTLGNAPLKTRGRSKSHRAMGARSCFRASHSAAFSTATASSSKTFASPRKESLPSPGSPPLSLSPAPEPRAGFVLGGYPSRRFLEMQLHYDGCLGSGLLHLRWAEPVRAVACVRTSSLFVLNVLRCVDTPRFTCPSLR